MSTRIDQIIASELQHVIFHSLTFDEKVQKHIAFYALAHNASHYDSEACAATASKRGSVQKTVKVAKVRGGQPGANTANAARRRDDAKKARVAQAET